jgi:hypothetical protein
VVRFVMPVGLLLPPGVRFGVDNGPQVNGRYSVCMATGCFVEAPVKDDFVPALKKGKLLNLSAQNTQGRVLTFAIPTDGFGKAFDGPAIDPQVLQARQKQAIEEIQRQQQELRNRLQGGAAQQGGAPAGQPGAAPAPTAPAPQPGTAPAAPAPAAPAPAAGQKPPAARP